MNLVTDHNKKVKIISSQIKKHYEAKQTQQIRFTHGSTNSTRVQMKSGYTLIDIAKLDHIIKIDSINKTAIVEPNVSMDKLVAACLQKGVIPKVVMEFPGITCGGAVNGAALEASSFQFGQFSDTCVAYECILGTGEVVTVSKKRYADLFYGISGSYGSLALVTQITLELIPAKKYIRLTFSSVKTAAIIDAIAKNLKRKHDYIEGVVYDKEVSLLLTGKLSDKTDDPMQTFSKKTDEWFFLYAKQQLTKNSQQTILVPIQDYLFRYNRGAFWMGRHAFDVFHIPFNSITRYILNPFMNTRTMYKGLHETNIAQNFFIQDFYIPFSQANKLLAFTMNSVGIYPLWLCPLKSTQTSQKLSPHYLKEKMLLDIGIWGRVSTAKERIETVNKQFERYVKDVGGRKMFYAESFYSKKEFWNIYDKKWYGDLRKKYKAERIFPTIWQKIRTPKRKAIKKWRILKTIAEVFSQKVFQNV